MARVQLLERGVERAAIGVSILRTIATILSAALGRELLVCAVFLVTHGDFLR